MRTRTESMQVQTDVNLRQQQAGQVEGRARRAPAVAVRVWRSGQVRRDVRELMRLPAVGRRLLAAVGQQALRHGLQVLLQLARQLTSGHISDTTTSAAAPKEKPEYEKSTQQRRRCIRSQTEAMQRDGTERKKERERLRERERDLVRPVLLYQIFFGKLGVDAARQHTHSQPHRNRTDKTARRTNRITYKWMICASRSPPLRTASLVAGF